jgi:predicted enzyme related to lactoylglutathione lyase
MPTIVHFEIPADDVERAKRFYSDLFGWKWKNGLEQIVLPLIWNTG